MAAALELSGQIETVLIDPVFLVDPLSATLVEPEEGIVEQTAGHEIGLHGAGHSGRMPVGKTNLTELPSLVESQRHG